MEQLHFLRIFINKNIFIYLKTLIIFNFKIFFLKIRSKINFDNEVNHFETYFF